MIVLAPRFVNFWLMCNKYVTDTPSAGLWPLSGGTAGGGIPEPRGHLPSPALGPAPGCPEQHWLERLWGFSKLVYLVLAYPSSFCEPPCLACKNALYFIYLIVPWHEVGAIQPARCRRSQPSAVW